MIIEIKGCQSRSCILYLKYTIYSIIITLKILNIDIEQLKWCLKRLNRESGENPELYPQL